MAQPQPKQVMLQDNVGSRPRLKSVAGGKTGEPQSHKEALEKLEHRAGRMDNEALSGQKEEFRFYAVLGLLTVAAIVAALFIFSAGYPVPEREEMTISAGP